MRNVKGPDGKYQINDRAFTGEDLVQKYQKRLFMAQASNWRVKPYRIVITDLHMGGINGFQASDQIIASFETALE